MSACIAWLDEGISQSRSNKETIGHIKQISYGRLQIFSNPDDCADYLTDVEPPNTAILIVNNRFGCTFLPPIHDLPQLKYFYVYCQNRATALSWASSYRKLGGIFTKPNELRNAIRKVTDASDPEKQILFSIFDIKQQEKTLQTLSKERAKFMWYRTILHVIPLLANSGNAKDEMVAECRAKYKGIPITLATIDEFEREYTPEKAIDWYKRDAFAFRILNEALRTQETEIIYKFRLFIFDLHNMIDKYYKIYLQKHAIISNNRLILYRGQMLPNEEVKVLQSSIGELIAMNSFLSTSKSRTIAEQFGGCDSSVPDDSLEQPVIFIMDVFNMKTDMIPFAVAQDALNCDDPEEEVIFSIGAIFKVRSVKRCGKIWEVCLQLDGEQDKCHTELFDHFLKSIGSEPGPLAFPWFLFRMSEFAKAEHFAETMLQQLPPEDRGIGDAYNLLAFIYRERGNIEKSIDFHSKALTKYSKIMVESSPQIIMTHCDLALAYLAIKDDRNTSEQFDEASRKLKLHYDNQNPLLRAKLLSVEGKIKYEDGFYEDALKCYEHSLALKRQLSLPEDSPSLLMTKYDIDSVRQKIGSIVAIESLVETLEIAEQSSAFTCIQRAEKHIEIGDIYRGRKEWKKALKHYQEAITALLVEERENELLIEKVQNRIQNIKRYDN